MYPEPLTELPTTSQFDHMHALLTATGILFIPNVAESFDYHGFARLFGPIVPQYGGAMEWVVAPDPKFDDHYHSLNTRPLNPHTEFYEAEGIPPRYLMLWCVTPCEEGAGLTTLCDGYAFVQSLSDAEAAYLAQHECEFVSSSGVQVSGLGLTARHPVVERRAGEPMIVRVSFNCMQYQQDSVMVSLMDRFRAFFEAHHQSTGWSQGAILLWDNWRILHSRTAFTDRRRELCRLFLGQHET
ncbi:MAG: TauD/TfdA family dioxygenase [Patescibacteria group bacterium]